MEVLCLILVAVVLAGVEVVRSFAQGGDASCLNVMNIIDYVGNEVMKSTDAPLANAAGSLFNSTASLVTTPIVEGTKFGIRGAMALFAGAGVAITAAICGCRSCEKEEKNGYDIVLSQEKGDLPRKGNPSLNNSFHGLHERTPLTHSPA